MLLDPVPVGADEAHDAPPASEQSRRRQSRKPALTRAEARCADARNAAILEANGIDFRPAQETSLLVLSTGVEQALPNLRERSFFAVHHRHRVAEMALTFDAFRQGRDLGNLRLVGLRPVEGKAPIGGLAEAFAAFSGAYNRHVGRLVTARTIEPVLNVLHVRFDVELGAWDLHAHALWDVPDTNIDAMWIGLGTHFSDKWMDGERVDRPGAAANYCLSWTIDHREIMHWPEEAVLELWKLERPRLIRPAGAFLACRRDLKMKVLRRDGDIVRIEDRPVTGPRREAAKRPGPPLEGTERVAAITLASVGGKRELCAIVKRPRADLRQADAMAEAGGLSCRSRARVDLAYGEYRLNSPNTELAPTSPEALASKVPSLRTSEGWVQGDVRAVLDALPARKGWMRKTWPLASPRRLPGAITRRLAARLPWSLVPPSVKIVRDRASDLSGVGRNDRAGAVQAQPSHSSAPSCRPWPVSSGQISYPPPKRTGASSILRDHEAQAQLSRRDRPDPLHLMPRLAEPQGDGGGVEGTRRRQESRHHHGGLCHVVGRRPEFADGPIRHHQIGLDLFPGPLDGAAQA